jgi:hypothetical protein
MGKVNRPVSLLTTFRELERRVRLLERAPRLTSASIRGGALKVYNKLGTLQLLFGDSATNGDTEFVVWREDGTRALAVYNGGQGTGSPQFASIWDRSGNIVLSDDTNSGVGHARPWIPLNITPTMDFNQASSTTSGSFVELLRISFFKQQPKISVLVWGATDPATTATIQLWDADNTNALGSNVSIGAGAAFVNAQWDAISIPGGYGAFRTLSVRARVDSGAGSVKALPVYAYGRQS